MTEPPYPPVLYGRLREVAAYIPLSLSARLAAGLIAVERWLRTTSIQDDQVTAVLEHMWRWMTVDPSTFDDWYDHEFPLLDEVRYCGFLPPQLIEACSVAGVPPSTLFTLLSDVVEMIYEHLFARVGFDVGLEELNRIRVAVAPAGVRLPDADQLRTSPMSEAGEWGEPLPPSTLSRWRALR